MYEECGMKGLNMEMKNLIITGVNGFIGSHAAKLFLQHNYNVIGTDVASVSIVEGIHYVQLNLISDDIDELLKEYKPCIIIHCAGMADVNYSIEHPDSDFTLNVMITRKLLYSIKEYAPMARFLFMSSAGVYGEPKILPITEKFELKPISPYALHKVMVEEMCSYFITQFNLDIRILRIFSCYGNGLKKQIFWDMGQKIKNTGCLKLFGTGNETRDFIHIDDLARAILSIAESSWNGTYIYNVANGVEVKIREIAQIFCQNMGCNEEIIVFTQQIRAGNPSNWCADISCLKGLGYRQMVSLEEGIKEYVHWLKLCRYV